MRGDFLRNRIPNSAVATAAATKAVQQRAKPPVLAEAVSACEKKRPAAARECSRGKHVRAQNEQDDENPKAAIAIEAIHSFSSLFAAEYVCFGFRSVIVNVMIQDKKMFP